VTFFEKKLCILRQYNLSPTEGPDDFSAYPATTFQKAFLATLISTPGSRPEPRIHASRPRRPCNVTLDSTPPLQWDRNIWDDLQPHANLHLQGRDSSIQIHGKTFQPLLVKEGNRTVVPSSIPNKEIYSRYPSDVYYCKRLSLPILRQEQSQVLRYDVY
jgi:hypothetical protein